MDQGQSSQATGTRDQTYDIVAVLYHALQGAENCQTYCNDASSDQELRGFFEQALNSQRQLADQAKMLLHDRLMKEGGQGGSAFRFGEGGSGGQGMGGSSGTSGGSDQFGSSGSSGSQGMSGSGQMRSDPTASQTNDPSSGQFGQSAYGQGQRHSEMTTGGGGTSTF